MNGWVPVGCIPEAAPRLKAVHSWTGGFALGFRELAGGAVIQLGDATCEGVEAKKFPERVGDIG